MKVQSPMYEKTRDSAAEPNIETATDEIVLP